MKRFVLFTLMALGLVSCSACGKKVPDPVVPTDSRDASSEDAGAPEAAPPIETLTLALQNISVTVTGSGWKQLEATEAMHAALNVQTKSIVIVAKEAVNVTMDAYTLETIRGVKSSGATVLSVKQVELNGHKYALIESTKGPSTVWVWVTVQDGFGYNLCCGGAPVIDQHVQCTQVSTTLQIK